MALWTENDEQPKKAAPVKEPAKAEPAPAADVVDSNDDGISDRQACIEEYQNFPENYQRAAAGEQVVFTSTLDYVWEGGTAEQPSPPVVEDPPAPE